MKNKMTKIMMTLAVSIFLTMTAQATVYTVNQLGDMGDSTCDATCTLRDAVTNANASADDDMINFSVTGTITLGGTELSIFDNGTLTINGPGASQLTVSGNMQSRVFNIYGPASATISGITVTGGNAGSDNFAGDGGGIINKGTLVISDSVVTGNSANDFAGGIYNFFGQLSISNSTISFNSVNRLGGGLYVIGGTSSVTNSTINNNTSMINGGGMQVQGTTTITNSTISNNKAGSLGGGILVSPGESITLTNVTIAENSAVEFGGGITNFGGTVKADNTIIAANSALLGRPDFDGILTSQGSNLIGNTSGTTVTGNETGNIYNVNPLLGPLQNNGGATFTHALLTGNPAIDAGNSGLTTDQRGFKRPVDVPNYPNAANGSDIGAFEFQGDAPTNKDQCKNGGWMNFFFPRTFKNQGDCIQFVNTGK